MTKPTHRSQETDQRRLERLMADLDSRVVVDRWAGPATATRPGPRRSPGWR